MNNIELFNKKFVIYCDELKLKQDIEKTVVHLKNINLFDKYYEIFICKNKNDYKIRFNDMEKNIEYTNVISEVLAIIEKIIINNRITFHGSCCIKDNDAYVFIGECGSGKSSIVSYLTTKGYTYISDDYIFIEQDTASAISLPIMLSENNNLLALYDELGYDRIASKNSKHIILSNYNAYSNKFKIKKIFFIDYNKKHSFIAKPLSHKVECYNYLIKHIKSYNDFIKLIYICKDIVEKNDFIELKYNSVSQIKEYLNDSI